MAVPRYQAVAREPRPRDPIQSELAFTGVMGPAVGRLAHALAASESVGAGCPAIMRDAVAIVGHMEQVPWARDLTRRLLAEPLPRRWAHSQGVGRKAESIAHLVGEDAGILVCAAWLHDVGYAPALVRTGLHSLDGARYLRDVEQVDDRVCRLVAHHSCASVEADNRGLADDLAAEFPPIDGFLSDALTYCDMTTGPDGEPVDVEVRLTEILARYGRGDVVHRSIATARQAITDAVQRVESVIAG